METEESTQNREGSLVDDFQRAGLDDRVATHRLRLPNQHESAGQIGVDEQNASRVLLHAAVVRGRKHSDQLAIESKAVAVATLVATHDQVEVESQHELLNDIGTEEVRAVARRRRVALHVGARVRPQQVAQQSRKGNRAGTLNVLNHLHGRELRRQTAVNATRWKDGRRATRFCLI